MFSKKKIGINSKAKELIKNFYYVILSNLISVFISIVVILFVPKFIGVEEYGYWQLYILYTSFVGLLHFGWNDGLYLRYGGRDYNQIDKKLFSSQFYLLFISQLILALVGFIVFYNLNFDTNKLYVLYMTMICMVIVNIRYMLLFLLQATYRIKEYSIITIFDRVLYFILIILLLLSNTESFKYLIWVDVIGKLVSLLLAIYYCSDIVLRFTSKGKIKLSIAINEALENIRVGIKLMLSNIASKLIVGNVRLGIETIWNVAVFGKVSLMLSITTFILVFINAVSLVLFPFLRKVDENVLAKLYKSIREVLTLILLLFLFSYFPIKLFLEVWLPEYSDSLRYLLGLYPVIIFEGKMSLLINTYLKVLRKEAVLLKINLLTFIVSILTTFVSVFLFKSIDIAIYTILFLSFFKSFLAELYIQDLLSINLWSSFLKEISIIAVFISANIFLDDIYSLLMYAVTIVCYLFFSAKYLKDSFKFFRLSAT
jgi:O-antigen/teichoic acid export membrane protein